MISRRFFLRGLVAMPAIVPVTHLMRLSVAPKLIYPAYGRSPCTDAMPDCLELQRLTNWWAERWVTRLCLGDPDAQPPTVFGGFTSLIGFTRDPWTLADYVPAIPAEPEDPDIAPPA
jgi:hypothetical protein